MPSLNYSPTYSIPALKKKRPLAAKRDNLVYRFLKVYVPNNSVNIKKYRHLSKLYDPFLCLQLEFYASNEDFDFPLFSQHTEVAAKLSSFGSKNRCIRTSCAQSSCLPKPLRLRNEGSEIGTTSCRGLRQYPESKEAQLVLRAIIDVNCPKFLAQVIKHTRCSPFLGISDLFLESTCRYLNRAELIENLINEIHRRDLQSTPMVRRKIHAAVRNDSRPGMA
ncbi:hypothetical protein NQ317_017178 [Molorchus minor]|uniref:Uncharacterized protein n=1 Tax=Molorchus minor TaxID=1323400 RepID=A0ABQ9IWY7_9CUCU|nr:hypothetical protein NQ317_017178 [Molorchus minor]